MGLHTLPATVGNLIAKVPLMFGVQLIPGLYMGWGLGANDSANIFGTAVATRVLSFKVAVTLTALFVFLGATLQGPGVMELFVEITTINTQQAIVSALTAAMTIHALTYLAIPSSTSQAIIGSVIGIGFITGETDYSSLGRVVTCWILTPIGAALIAFFIFFLLKNFVENRLRNLAVFELFLKFAITTSGCYGAYALGANNVPNVTGVYYSAGLLSAQSASMIGGLAIAFGAITYSKKVMYTVGEKITSLDPFTAFIAVLSVALTVHIFTFVGVPVSTSQAIVGAVVGIGLVKGVRAITKRTLLHIGVGWVVTPLASGILAYMALMILGLFP